jgi:hypothetical protein
MPPVTRSQATQTHRFVFLSKPLPSDHRGPALRRGVWVYLEVPARSAHLYGLRPKRYLVNYMETFPGNHLDCHLLPDALRDIRAFFRDYPNMELDTSDTTALVAPGHGVQLK